MTQEEKAKAYDEALERARANYKADKEMGFLENCDMLELIFPELKESEDERIIRLLRELGSLDAAKELYEEFNLSYTDVLYWLEKQKENPKFADSIPADCTSDAKCEDRWHKVADFLPDSGRDVLAKDALGNCLLASFDGDQWFVSVYDGEDKPIVYTPAIKEWCDIPSEKQKEQKNYRKLYEDIAKSEWFKKAYVGKSLGEEDEKEEQKPWKVGANAYFTPEHKPAEWSDKDEKVYDYLKGGFEYATNNPNLLNSVLSGASDATIQDYRNFIDKLKILRPQPKQEWSEVELEFRGEKVKVKRPFFRDDKGRGYSTTEQDDEVTWNALRAWAEAHGHTPFELYPKVEWSEEDEEVRRQLICVLSGGIALTTKETRSKMLEWLKSLRPNWKPTEEQMEALKCAILDVARFSKRGGRQVEFENEPYYMALHSLYEHLKKL